MPLSNDFTNTRLSYLQDAIKNTKVVAEQFYPRFVREYNEQFPFTEPSLSNVGNPISNTTVKGYLKPKSTEQVLEELFSKITTLTNDEGVSRYIGRALAKKLTFPVLSYYNDNFDKIQKQIPISRDGISKDLFVNKVLSVLRSDTFKDDISVLEDTTPRIRETVLQPKLDVQELVQALAQAQQTQTQTLAQAIADAQAQAQAQPQPPATPQAQPPATPQTQPQPVQAVNARLVRRPGPALGVPRNDDKIDLNIKTDKQYRALYNAINAKMNGNKTPDPYPVWKANYQKAQQKKIEKQTRTETESQPAYKNFGEVIGTGIQLPPLRIQHRVIKHKQVFNNSKYAIDTKKLKKNILDLKYVKNANHVATFQPIEISNHLKTIIDNIIKDHYNLQTESFDDLNTTEKRILKRLFKFLKIQNTSLETNSNNSVQHNFEVAYGSFLAGNNNKELINELIQYVKLALHESTISKKDGYEILKKLNNK